MGEFEVVAPSFNIDTLVAVIGGGGVSATILRSTRAISTFGPRKQELDKGKQEVKMDAPAQKHARDNMRHEPFVSVEDLAPPTRIESAEN